MNWDPKGQTVISDDEVMHEERKAKLYTFRYDKNFPISIATTRLETKFGDTAVAVHPSDERYKQYVGKEFDAVYCGIPIHIKVIADESVEKDFGTGALGVTPAHSMIDWEIADRHGLPLKQIINEYGKMTVEGPVNGMKTEEARTWVAEELKKLGLIEKEEEITQNVSIAERTGAIIEPLPKLQWFVAVNKPFENGSRGTITLKQMMRDAVSSGKVRITPEQFEKVYFHWIDNLRDWCISRQIWFGHRVPVWYKGDEIFVDVDAPAGEGWTQDSDTLDTWFSSGLWPFSTLGWPMGEKSMGFHESLVPMVKKGEKTKTYRLTDKNFIPSQIVPTDNSQTNEKFGFLRIKSVTKKTVAELDPQEAGHEKYKDAADLMATLQGYYPALKVTKESPVWVYEFSYQRTSDLETYFPNTLMAPGYEILPLWVARMILMSGVLLESIPFKTVLIHGIVRDSKGQKFSKSLGNGIDPLILANTYGADALRMGLTVGSAPGNDIKFDEQRIKGYRNFSTKIWNIARFIEMNKPVASSPAPSVTLAEARVRASSDAHQKYLSDIAALKKEVSAHLDNFEFHLAGEKLYHYVWHEFADVVIEAEKETLKNGIDEEKTASYAVLEQLLLESLKMLHPFMPFITEEIYQIFRPGKMLMVEKW